MIRISKFCDFDFQSMVRTRDGMIGNQNRGHGREHGRGRARGRGRGRDVQSEDIRLVEIADVPARSQMSIRELFPSSTSVGNERGDRPNVHAASPQGNTMSAVPASVFERVPRRARNMYYAPQLEVPGDVPNPLIAPIVHIDATDLARTMATVLAERERYWKPGDACKKVWSL